MQETKNDMNVMIYVKSVCCCVALPETFVTLSIRRLQARSAMEQETKNDMEAQNLDLRRQLAKLTTRLRKHPVFLGASLPDM